MRPETKLIENDGLICDLLFKQIQKPKDVISCRAINVYDNKYRINVYVKAMIHNIDSQRIGYSCFARLEDKKLSIVSETPQASGKIAL
jgi:hypothetical protein